MLRRTNKARNEISNVVGNQGKSHWKVAFELKHERDGEVR